jgi:type I restriction enzyme, R subunit
VLHVSEPGSDADRSAEFRDLRERLAADLRNEIAGMSLDNFLVRPKRRFVEKYAAVAAWSRLDADAQQELEQVAGLPSAAADGDLAAKQFDLIVFRMNWRCCRWMRRLRRAGRGSLRSPPCSKH